MIFSRHCSMISRSAFTRGAADTIWISRLAPYTAPQAICSSFNRSAASLAAVIAPSFSGLYFRNAFNLGLLLLTCERATEIQEGERIAVRWTPGSDTPEVQRADGEPLPCAPIPAFLMDMVQAGGLLPLLKQQRRRAHDGH